MRRLYGFALAAAVLVVAAAWLWTGGLRPWLGGALPEQRVMSVAADLRCPVCQGESVATSNAAVAVQMRNRIAADLAAGEPRRQILQGFAREYGTWILYRPPGSGALAVLWVVPGLAVCAVALGVARYLRLRPVRPVEGGPPAEGAGPPSAALQRRLRGFL